MPNSKPTKRASFTKRYYAIVNGERVEGVILGKTRGGRRVVLRDDKDAWFFVPPEEVKACDDQ